MTEILETLEGWFALHEFKSLDWVAWQHLSHGNRREIWREFEGVWKQCDAYNIVHSGAFGVYEILGHKADFLFLNLREDLHALSQAQRLIQKTRLGGFMRSNYSYLSAVELSNYVHSSSQRTPEIEAMIQARLHPKLPQTNHICFYPMNKRREGQDNWYRETLEERRRMMKDHGSTGRQYAGRVSQMIGGSIGLDDWEWGVTLFSNDAITFKHIVTEMRFDEVSARFAEFGPFYVGNRIDVNQFYSILSGSL